MYLNMLLLILLYTLQLYYLRVSIFSSHSLVNRFASILSFASITFASILSLLFTLQLYYLLLYYLTLQLYYLAFASILSFLYTAQLYYLLSINI